MDGLKKYFTTEDTEDRVKESFVSYLDQIIMPVNQSGNMKKLCRQK